jgi:hypothetical protein
MSTDNPHELSVGEDIIVDSDSVVDLSNYGAASETLSIGSAVDTITLDPSSWNNMTTSITSPSTYTIGTSPGINGSYYSSANYAWANSSTPTVNITGNGIEMPSGSDITIDGKSLKNFISKMEERLAILVPDPAKLEKFEALKKAYEHYKLMEKLCQELPKEED